jgi:hypothetical protein
VPSVSRMSRQCGILNSSQPSMPPMPVTEISLLVLIPITGGGGLLGCEMSRILNFLDNPLKDGRLDITLMCCYSFLLEPESTTRPLCSWKHQVKRKKFDGLNGTQIHDLLVCSIVPQPTTPLRAPRNLIIHTQILLILDQNIKHMTNSE